MPNSLGIGTWKTVLESREITKNINNKGKKQSSIDLHSVGGKCEDRNEIRDLPGDFHGSGSRVQKHLKATNCDLTRESSVHWCQRWPKFQEPDPPNVDFLTDGMDSWMSYIINPGKPSIQSERFDAEMQISHIHPDRKRLAVFAV